MNQPEVSLPSEFLSRQNRKPRKKNRAFWRILGYAILFAFLLISLFLLWFFFTPSGTQKRNVLADTIISTQHRVWAKYLIGTTELQKRVDAYSQQFNEYAAKPVTEKAIIPDIIPIQKDLIDIKPISGSGYKGYLMTISDPKKIRLVVPERKNKGEKVSSMVNRTGALAGVNGGGFIDPNWEGNGFQPEGIVISVGKILYKDVGMNTPIHIMGIDKAGQMIAGRYSPAELLEMNVMEAVSFAPRFIVNGVGQIKNQSEGWGIAPRTCMAQKRDGSIMFVVIDGRQPGYSIGASLYDVQQILLENDAIIAANLDGGASTVLVKDNEIINRPSSKYGERYLPTAWLVFDNPDSIYVPNVWEGLDPSQIDPSKW
ncbi:MAG: phosphodiester glycosidase family protein [Paenibacillaceae bacterium]